MLDGLRGEDSISEFCRREGIAQNLYYRWSKEFLEAGKKRLAGEACSHDEHTHHLPMRQWYQKLDRMTRQILSSFNARTNLLR